MRVQLYRGFMASCMTQQSSKTWSWCVMKHFKSFWLQWAGNTMTLNATDCSSHEDNSSMKPTESFTLGSITWETINGTFLQCFLTTFCEIWFNQKLWMFVINQMVLNMSIQPDAHFGKFHSKQSLFTFEWSICQWGWLISVNASLTELPEPKIVHDA